MRMQVGGEGRGRKRRRKKERLFHDSLTNRKEKAQQRAWRRRRREILDAPFECRSRKCGGKIAGSSLHFKLKIAGTHSLTPTPTPPHHPQAPHIPLTPPPVWLRNRSWRMGFFWVFFFQRRHPVEHAGRLNNAGKCVLEEPRVSFLVVLPPARNPSVLSQTLLLN